MDDPAVDGGDSLGAGDGACWGGHLNISGRLFCGKRAKSPAGVEQSAYLVPGWATGVVVWELPSGCGCGGVESPTIA
ncbi:MAG: hypothetical protein M1420_03570 [Actinobacteria bacterium]|nr:hypothetical protein [Actinomycetota bacterium]